MYIKQNWRYVIGLLYGFSTRVKEFIIPHTLVQSDFILKRMKAQDSWKVERI